jgi:hypothetical protein
MVQKRTSPEHSRRFAGGIRGMSLIEFTVLGFMAAGSERPGDKAASFWGVVSGGSSTRPTRLGTRSRAAPRSSDWPDSQSAVENLLRDAKKSRE